MDLSLFIMKASQWSSPEDFAKHLSKGVMRKLENNIRAKKENHDLFHAMQNGDFDELLEKDSLFMKSQNPKEDEE